MFTIHQIKEAHSKVKTGADFPNYIQDLIQLGVKSYTTFVADGHSEYYGENEHKVLSESKYSELKIAEKSNPDTFKSNLKIHQLGQTDYMTFCNHSAESGVEKWEVDLLEMTCTYFDKNGTILLIENIPS